MKGSARAPQQRSEPLPAEVSQGQFGTAGVRALGGEGFELELTGTPEHVPVSIAFKNRFRGT